MTNYKTPQYIADLKFNKVPADADWKGIINPLTVYDRIYATKEKYEYPDLYNHFDKISANGKRSLGTALHEWIVNRVGKEYGDDITYFYPVIEAFWAASIDKRYGGCNIPDFEYELINNQTERKNGEPAFIQSDWPAKGELQNIFYSSMIFVEHQEDVDTGPNPWLERSYYLALYLMPDTIKPMLQQWFTMVLERLEKYTPNCSFVGQYEDVFDEYWIQNRGLPVTPQLFDTKSDYKPEQNTPLIHEFLSKLNYTENRYLNDPDELLENGFIGTPYTFKGLIEKERKTLDLNSLVPANEDLSSLSTPPAIIRASDKKLNKKFLDNEEFVEELEIKYTDDNDGYADIDYDKLSKILKTIDWNITTGLALCAAEWIIALLKNSTDTGKTEMLVESMWAKMDINYLKVGNVETNEDDEVDDEEDGEYLVKDATNKILVDIQKRYNDALHLLILARNIQDDKSLYDAWVDNAIKRIKTDFPQSNTNDKDENKQAPIVSRNYFFNPNSIYNEQEMKNELNTFISKLDYKKNPFLPNPEEVYLMSYTMGEINENPYNQNLKFPKNITPEKISILGDGLQQSREYKLALKCFDTAEKLDPNDPFSYAYRGLYYYEQEEYQSAIDYLSKAILCQPKSSFYYYQGASYYKLEKYEEAYQAFSKSIELDEEVRENEEFKDLSRKFTDLSHSSIESKEYDLAIEQANKAILLDPKNATAYLNRGVGYHFKGDVEKSRADRETVRKLDPKGSGRTYINESVTLNKKGKHREALEKGLIALKFIDEGDKEELSDTYQEIGYAYGELMIFDKALEYMSKSIEYEDKTDALKLANRAYYLRTFGRFEEALEDYNCAIKILPEGWKAFLYDNRGKAYAALEQFDKALSDWETVYTTSKSLTGLVYIIYGQVSCGDIKSAKESLDKALKMDESLDDDDELLYSFLQYSFQINMDEALSQCKYLLEKNVTNEDFPLTRVVQMAIDKDHPDKDTLADIAEKINKSPIKESVINTIDELKTFCEADGYTMQACSPDEIATLQERIKILPALMLEYLQKIGYIWADEDDMRTLSGTGYDFYCPAEIEIDEDFLIFGADMHGAETVAIKVNDLSLNNPPVYYMWDDEPKQKGNLLECYIDKLVNYKKGIF